MSTQPESPGRFLTRHHHITLCTGEAQEDYDFHTKILGLKSVKKTLLYDGQVPIYHLYYGNDMGDESSLVTTFPMRHTGRKARKGSEQVSRLTLSAPVSAIPFWKERLEGFGFEVTETERFGEPRLDFQHPCGIDYSIVGVSDDVRVPHTTGPVPQDLMIRGTHSIEVSMRDTELMDEFVQLAWGGSATQTDGVSSRYEIGRGGSGALVDFVLEPQRKPGSWAHGEGFIHHMAFQIGSHEEQDALKAHLEGIGFIDVSDVKDRGYFDSIYVRTPSGALFEATVTHPKGFASDETPAQLGQDVMISPQFEESREELVAQLGVLRD